MTTLALRRIWMRWQPKVWPLGLYRVRGESMRPLLAPGQLVLGTRWFRPQVGQIVVARLGGRLVIKRISRLEAGSVWLEGDNAVLSTDSRHFGAVAQSALQARVIK